MQRHGAVVMQKERDPSSTNSWGRASAATHVTLTVLAFAAVALLASCFDGPVQPRVLPDQPQVPGATPGASDTHTREGGPVEVIGGDVPVTGGQTDGGTDPDGGEGGELDGDDPDPDPDPNPKDSPWDKELPPPPAGSYAGLWAEREGSIWIVGDGGKIAHFDGQRWSAQASATAHDLRRVRGISGQHLWAVGRHGAVVHYEGGSAWEAMLLPQGEAIDLSDVYMASPDETWAVGWDSAQSCGVILRRTTPFRPTAGAGRLGLWREMRCIANKKINGIDGFSAGQIVAVGDNGFVTRFDGSAWVDRHWGSMDFARVWGLSATAYWAVGAPDIFWYWNGTGWLGGPGPERAGYRTLHGVTSDRIWVVPDAQHAVFANEGGVWSRFPTGGGAERLPIDVFAHPRDGVWVLLAGGTILHRSEP